LHFGSKEKLFYASEIWGIKCNPKKRFDDSHFLWKLCINAMQTFSRVQDSPFSPRWGEMIKMKFLSPTLTIQMKEREGEKSD
jgi:hypothetical protein